MTPGHVTRCKLLDLYSGTLHGSLLHRSRNNLVINHSGDYATRVSLRTFQVLRSRDIASHVTGAPEDGPSGFFTLYPGVPLDPLHKGERPGHVTPDAPLRGGPPLRNFSPICQEASGPPTHKPEHPRVFRGLDVTWGDRPLPARYLATHPLADP